MDTGQVIARFEAERQALALMDHPNIAQVLDGGRPPRGRPYFVMELVKRRADHRSTATRTSLTPRERLELFVAGLPGGAARPPERHHPPRHQAVQRAGDAARRPAGAEGHRLRRGQGDRSAVDRTDAVHELRRIIGTPLYMSPEQAELNGLGHRHAHRHLPLGVLLYELLTGTTPLDKERLQEAALREVLRHDPRRGAAGPSTRLSDRAIRWRRSRRNRKLEPAS